MSDWKYQQPIPLINVCAEEGGTPVELPSLFHSFLLWRMQLTEDSSGPWGILKANTGGNSYHKVSKDDVIRMFSKKANRPYNGICPQCKGNNIIYNEKSRSSFWCLCQVVEWAKNQCTLNDGLREFVNIRKFSEFSLDWGESKEKLTLLKSSAMTFAKNPSRWLILSGPPGIGKSHLLSSVAAYMGPISLFTTAGKMVQNILASVKNGNLEDIVETYSTTPVLLIDDLGAEYIKSNESFVMSQVLQIVNNRYQDCGRYPLMITTNQSANDFRKPLWERLGDRFLDGTNNFVEINIKSYRQSEERKNE